MKDPVTNKAGLRHRKTRRGKTGQLVLFCLAQLLCFATFANGNEIEQQKSRFIQLVQAGQLNEAYQLASDLEIELSGDPDFDFAYGRIALSVGQFDRAVFALERAVAEQPQWHQARFILAQAYFTSKNYPAATIQLDALQSAAVPELEQAIRELRRAIDFAEIKLKGYQRHKVRYGVGHDDNVNSGTAEDRIFIPALGEIDVFPQSKQSSDVFHQLGYSFDGRWQQDQRYALVADMQLGASRFNELSAFDRETLALRLGYDADYQHYSYSLRAYSRPLRLGGELYRNDWGGQLSGRYELKNGQSLGLQWVSGRSDNRIDDRLNLTAHGLTASWERKSAQWIHRAELGVTAERSRLASADYNSRDYGSVSYTGIWVANAANLLIARAEWQDIRYKAPHPLFLITRDESLLSLTASWVWQYSDSVSTELRCSYTDKNSPVSLYEYDRTECVIGASYAF